LLATVKVRWWLFIARRKRKHEQYAGALEVLYKIIAVQPQRALAFVQAGYCLAKLNRQGEACVLTREHSKSRQIMVKLTLTWGSPTTTWGNIGTLLIP
jgi:hypothetical protein